MVDRITDGKRFARETTSCAITWTGFSTMSEVLTAQYTPQPFWQSFLR
jgi:hypothetical protein